MIASKRLQYANNVNAGMSNTISGSDIVVPNTGVLRSVNGLSFSNSIVRSFVVNVNISIVRSTGGNLFETFTLEGNQKASSWDLYVTSIGDNTSTTFSITSSGQVQHTTAVVANWTSTTIVYSGTQVFINNNVTNFTAPTSGSSIVSLVRIGSTDDTTNGSGGSLVVAGGASISKTLTALNLNATSISTSSLRIPGTLTVTNITVSNLANTNGSITVTANSNTIGSIITTGGNVGVGTVAPTRNLHVNGDVRVNDIYSSSIPASLAALLPKVGGSFRVSAGTITVLRTYNCSIAMATVDYPGTTSIVKITYTNALSTSNPIIANAFQRLAAKDFLNFFWASSTHVYFQFYSNTVAQSTFPPVHFVIY